MQLHAVRVSPEAARLPRDQQLAHKLARLAADPVPVESEVQDMIVNRIIDNAATAVAALNRQAPTTARAQALAHRRASGATVMGVASEITVSAEWAAWANGTAVRELDFHDTFLAADYSHPGDNVPPVLAVAQQCGRSGGDLMRGIAAAYEVQVNLVKGICLHEHKIDHVAHLGPSAAAGIGACLGLDADTIYQAIQHALHVTTATRQSRKGEISSWKAFAPAHAGKLAVEAVDRAMRGEDAPSPIYEGEDSVIAWMLGGPEAAYQVPLPEPGAPKRAILETYTKAHSAEYQAQALIDLAFRVGRIIEARTGGDWDRVQEVVLHTSHHTHHVIGTGANDPQKSDPNASRETLDHSILYILAVALQDGEWHHERSYTRERATRPDTVRLWQKIRTLEDPDWTRRYHSADPNEKAFGGRLEVTLDDGGTIVEAQAVADAHPLGAKPFAREQYIDKFRTLAEGIVPEAEQSRFLEAARESADLAPGSLGRLNAAVPEADLRQNQLQGIF